MSKQVYCDMIASHRPRWVLGFDEVGTGAWAGPVYMAGCCVPVGFQFDGLKDSKGTSEPQRERQFDRLVDQVGPGWFRVVGHSPNYVDRFGLRPALVDMLDDLMAKFVKVLGPAFDNSVFVVDGDLQPSTFWVPGARLLVLPKADTFVPAVMAAANIAKVMRDRYMRSIEEEDERYRPYRFASNKGYRSPEHEAALARYGVTNEHRLSYRPMCEMVARTEGR